jgi:hypothetical protein
MTCRMPSEKTAVLPVPDWDWAMTSRPVMMGLMARCWMAEGRSKPYAYMPRSRSSLSPIASKDGSTSTPSERVYSMAASSACSCSIMLRLPDMVGQGRSGNVVCGYIKVFRLLCAGLVGLFGRDYCLLYFGGRGYSIPRADHAGRQQSPPERNNDQNEQSFS